MGIFSGLRQVKGQWIFAWTHELENRGLWLKCPKPKGVEMEGMPMKILLVDDDEEEFLILQKEMDEVENLRVELEWVGDYHRAIEIIRKNRHDVYLVDYCLGARSGLELIEQCQENGCTKPLIIFSGRGDAQVDEEAIALGAADYLPKDMVDPKTLEQTLRHAVGRYEVQEFRHQENLEKLAKDMAGDFNLLFNSIAENLDKAMAHMKATPEGNNALNKIRGTVQCASILCNKIMVREYVRKNREMAGRRR